MATTIRKTIGTGGDYADPAAWYASIPANLVTADEIHQGVLLNQEFTTTTAVTISGKTTDSTRYIELTTETGCSFRDHANKATNAQRYNASVGAAWKTTSANPALVVTQSYTRVSNIQFMSTNTGSTAQPVVYTSGAVSNIWFDNCIFEGYGINTAQKGVFRCTPTGSRVRNCLVIQLKNDVTAFIAGTGNGVNWLNCTLVSLGTTVTAGLQTAISAAVLKNCYIGGVSAPEDGSVVSTKTNCHTNATATNYTTTAFSTATFENISAGTHDFRLKSGSALIDVGVNEALITSDIIGTARNNGSYDVGSWEFVAASTPVDGTLAWTEADDVTSITANLTVEGVSGTISYTEDNDTCSITAANTVGTLSTTAFKNNTGSVLASLTGLTVTVLNASTLAFVKNFTSQTTNASGILSVQDPLIISGTEYAIVTTNATGTLGVEKYTAT